MKKLINIVSILIGAGGGFLFGELNGLIIAIIVFIILDYITGVLNAAYNRGLSSRVGFNGLLKKICILIIICVSHMIDMYLLKGGSIIRDACICFYISNEGISILENIVGMGVPVPDKLKLILDQIKDRGEKDGNEKTNK